STKASVLSFLACQNSCQLFRQVSSLHTRGPLFFHVLPRLARLGTGIRTGGSVALEFAGQHVHDVHERTTFGDHRTLPFVGGALVQGLGDQVQVLGAAQPGRHRPQFENQLVQVVSERNCGSVCVRDDMSVESVASGPPLVVLHHPGRRAGQTVPAVELVIEQLHQALRESGCHSHLVQCGNPVEHPDLYGAEIRVRTDIPPHFLDRGDGTCPQKSFEVFLESGPVWKVRRWAGGRQGTEDDRPCRGQPGVVSSPKGAGSTQGEKMREGYRKYVVHRNNHVPVVLPHLYVDTSSEAADVTSNHR